MISTDLQIYIGVTAYPGEIEDDEKELEHTSLQEKLDRELKELDKRLEQKEVSHKWMLTFSLAGLLYFLNITNF